jgi:hypothetical protein
MKLDSLDINIFLNDSCNWNCSYCGQNQHSNKKINKEILYKNLKKFKKELNNFLKINKISNINIIFQGGELSTDIKTLTRIKEIKNMFEDIPNLNYIFLTNFSGNLKYFDKLLTILDIKVIATLHQEYINEKLLIEFITKAELLNKKYPNKIIFNLLYSTDPNFRKLLKLLNKYNIFDNDLLKIEKDFLIKKGKNFNGKYGLPLVKEKEIYINKKDIVLNYHFEKDSIIDIINNTIMNYNNFNINITNKIMRMEK